MKKETFKYLYSFKYKNKEYIYLISKNYPFYFLEYNSNTNSFSYPDIITFKDLYNNFYSNNIILGFDVKNGLNKIKNILCNMNINIEPFIRTSSGLLSLAIVLSMCSCVNTNKNNTSNNTETSIVFEDKDQDIYNYFKNYNIDVTNREYDGNDYIFVNDFVNSNNKHQVTLQSFDEFRDYNNINFIPTYDDVIKAFQDNQNIDDEKKKIILDCINNMQKYNELKEMDLSVLYVNAKRMKFKYLSDEDMATFVGRDFAYACFDTTSGTVYLPKDKPLKRFEFIHEVLGHGSLAYRDEIEDKIIVFDCTNHIMIPTEDNYTGYSLGIMISEGGANMIAHFATNDYSIDTFYELFEEELRVISELCNISIGKLFNYKGISFYDLMYKNKINTPVEYIFKMDGICNGKLYCEFSDLMERLFVDATEEEIINAPVDKQDDIINNTIEVIKNSYFSDKGELQFKFANVAINYNFDDTADNYEEKINQIKK